MTELAVMGWGGAEYVVVLSADAEILVSAELLADWRAGSPHVAVGDHGIRFTFGTPGKGVGRVTYTVVREPALADLRPTDAVPEGTHPARFAVLRLIDRER